MVKIKGVVYKKLLRRNAVGLVEGDDDVIYIDPRLRGKKHLEILLHEALHVLYPAASEEEVIENSIELTKLLWKQHYRRIDNDRSQPLQDGTV